MHMGLIARVTSNGKDTNCTRRSRVLLTLPVLVMIILIIAKWGNTTLVGSYNNINFHHLSSYIIIHVHV